MKLGLVFGILFAVFVHAGFIFLGGLLFGDPEKNHGTLQTVELLSDEPDEKKPEDTALEDPTELEAETEEIPDATEIIKNLEISPVADTPALDAASLSAIEAALNGQAGSGEFGGGTDFTSGGVIGGKGKAGAIGDQLDNAFSLAEIDQKPRAVFQNAPLYPAEMRGKKMEGVVTVIFVVDSAGKVANPRVEKSNHTAFEKPALNAVKKWKFEPAIKAGERVACKMRIPIRFPPS